MMILLGGNGFLGSQLRHTLKVADVDFASFDKSLTTEGYVDVTLPESFRALPDAELVINLVAEHRDDVYPISLYDEVNVNGAVNVCNFCRDRNVNRIIFISSVAVYGDAKPKTDELGSIKPSNDYGRTKYQAEEVYREWFNEKPDQRSLTIIRPTVIFGEGNRGNVYNLLRQIASGIFFMIGDGKNYKSMAYVGNVAEFIFRTTKLDAGLHLFNYVDGPDLNMNELVLLVRKNLFGKDNVGIRIPVWLAYSAGKFFDLVARVLNRKFPISAVRIKKFCSTSSFRSSNECPSFEAPHDLLQALEQVIDSEIKETRPNRTRSQ